MSGHEIRIGLLYFFLTSRTQRACINYMPVVPLDALPMPSSLHSEISTNIIYLDLSSH